MLRSIQRIPVPTFSQLFLVVFGLFATSCRGVATTDINQFHTELPTSTPPSQFTGQVASTAQFPPENRIRFDNISTEQGLSQSTVTAILQDRQGFMWFGTEGGLNKFDGYQFTVYKHDPQDPKSVSDSVITSLYEDRDGTLWVGTSAGLDRLDRRSGAFEHYKQVLTGSDNISRVFVSVIYQDHLGTLWIGTYGDGLVALDLSTNHSKVFKNSSDDPNTLTDNMINSIHEDRDGVLWIGTDMGINHIDPTSRTFVTDPQKTLRLGVIEDVPVYAIYEDHLGRLWIGTKTGLYQWNRAEDQLIEYYHDQFDPDSISDDSIRCIFEDSQGALWIGTRSGLDQFYEDQERFISYRHNSYDPQSLISDSIRSIFEDRSGVLWIGTAGGGLSKYARIAQKFPLYKSIPGLSNSLSDNNIWSIFEDQNDNIWIGTFSSGLNKLDRHSGTVTVFQNIPGEVSTLSSNDIRAIHEDRKGNLWIGTEYGGLNRFDPQTESFFHYQHDDADPKSLSSDAVFVIYEDSLGRMWIGTQGGGLNLLEQDSETFTHFLHDPTDPHSLSNNAVKAIFEDQTGILWIGTLGGVNLFDKQAKHLAVYQHDPGNPSSLSSDLIASIFVDSAGNVWIGTFGGGLNRFDGDTRSFIHFNENDGLPDNTVYGILEDTNGALWLSTNNGLSKFDPHLESFQNYNISDGLQGNQFNPGAYFQSKDGELFFGGTRGINAFFPDQVMDNPVPPPVVITDFKVFNQTVQTDLQANEFVQLNYQDSFISFEFAALDYNAPDKNQFSYKLEGVEENWVDTGTRHYASYTHLPAGKYVFRVKASNNDGIWNDVGTAVHITIVPPFWATWWFRGIILLVLVGGVYGGYRLRVRTIEARSFELESQVKQRTDELMNTQEALRQSELEQAITEERNRLARDLHDSVTQSVYSVTLLAEGGQRMIKSRDLEQAEENQSRIREIAQQALQEMRLLVYELRPQVLQNEGLTGSLEQRLEAVERRAGIDAHLRVDMDVELPKDLEAEFFHISQEALNNALKHARASKVVLSICADQDNLRLEVEDNGQGFDQNLVNIQGGMGLASMGERVEKIGGKLTIQSVPGAGTTLRVIAPIKHPTGSQADTQISSDNQEVS